MNILIRRCSGNRDAWGAFVGVNDFIVATSLSLDTLVEIIVERHANVGGALQVTLQLDQRPCR